MVFMPKRIATESKVRWSTAGGATGFVLADFVVWAVDWYGIGPGVVGDIPMPVATALSAAVGAALAWYAGRKAKHAARPDLPPSQR
jgi:hypothetical protein